MGLGFRIGESTTSQELVLDLLIDGAGDDFTATDITRTLGLPRSTVSRALKDLVDQDVVAARPVGRTLLYAVDAQDPLVRHLKIARAITRTRVALRPVADAVDLAVLFGSASRGEDTTDSDLDLLVVTMDVDRVLAELARIEGMQPVVVTPSQHMQILAEGGTFAAAVAAGIRVMGSS